MLAIQFEASHADTNNEPDQERQTIASGVLLSLGDVRFPTGEDGPLNLVKIPGGGWCFYDAAARKLGVEDWGYATLDCIALPALSIQKVDFAAYAVEDGDECGTQPSLKRSHRRADILDVYVLDKLKGVLAKHFDAERRWADFPDIEALLTCLGLRALVLNPRDSNKWRLMQCRERARVDIVGFEQSIPDVFFRPLG